MIGIEPATFTISASETIIVTAQKSGGRSQPIKTVQKGNDERKNI